jgi:hypothetical protein
VALCQAARGHLASTLECASEHIATAVASNNDSVSFCQQRELIAIFQDHGRSPIRRSLTTNHHSRTSNETTHIARVLSPMKTARL